MFGLTYLSNDNRTLLEKLYHQLDRDLTPKKREEMQFEIDKIEKTRKPYTECNLDESDELRSQLSAKIDALYRIQKINSVQVFVRYLEAINEHIQLIRLNELRKLEKMPNSPQPSLNNDKHPSLKALHRNRERETYGHVRWFTDDFDDEIENPHDDIDENLNPDE